MVSVRVITKRVVYSNFLNLTSALLANSNQFEFVTVKVVGQQFFVVLGKKEMFNSGAQTAPASSGG